MSVAVWHLYGQIWLYEDCPPGSDDLALRSHHIGIQTLSTSLWLGARGNSSVMTRLQSFCCCLSQTDGSLHIVYWEGGGRRTQNCPGLENKTLLLFTAGVRLVSEHRKNFHSTTKQKQLSRHSDCKNRCLPLTIWHVYVVRGIYWQSSLSFLVMRVSGEGLM